MLLLLLLLRGVAKSRDPPALARRRAGPRVTPWRALLLGQMLPPSLASAEVRRAPRTREWMGVSVR